jgi:PAS domain S-box-containing protein
MQFVNNYLISFPLIALFIALFLMVSVRRYRTKPIATTFLALMSTLAWWSLTVVLEHASLGLSAKVFWVKMSYFGIVTLPPAWVVFTLQYANREKWLTRRNLAMLTIMPVITLVMVWSNDIFHLMWKNIWLDTSLSPPVDAVTHNIGFWVQAIYAYLLLLLGTVTLFGVFLRSSGIFRKQAGTMLLATVVPWVGNFLYITGVGPFRVVDPTSLAFTITGIAFWWGLSYFHIMDIMPIAHEVIFKNTTDGVIVVDEQSRITVINPAAEQILGLKRADVVGRLYSHVLPGQADLTELKPDMSHTPPVISTGEGQTRRYYAVYVSPINVRNHFNGHLVLLHDDTERRKAEVESRERIRLETEIIERERAEEVLRESEGRYRDLFENSSNLIQSIAPDGQIIYVNKAWLETLGYTEAELPLLNLFNIIHPDSLPHYQEAFSKVVAGESLRDIQATFVKKDGRSVQLEGSVTPRIIDGRMVSTHGIFHDITERKRAEELFETLANDSSVGVYIVQDGKFCYVNPNFQSFTGYTEGELLGRDSLDLVIPEDRNIVRENIVNMLKGKLFSPYYFRVTDKNRGTRWVMESVTSIQYHGRQATLGSYMDITEHRQVEEALKLQKAYFEQLFDNSPDAIVMLDTSDRIVQVNKGFETLFGYSNPEIKGRLIDELIIPEDRVKEALALSQATQSGEAVRKETVRRRRDGSLVDVSVLGYPIYIDDNLVGVYVIYSDITERKRVEEQYRTVARNSPVGAYIFQEGKFRFVNSQFQKATGYSEDKLLDMAPWQLIYPEDRSEARRNAIQMLKGERSSPYEFRVIDPSGEIHWAMETLTSISYNGKQATIGSFIDITELKRMEQLQQGENYVLHLMGQGAELKEVLDAIVNLGEQYDPGIKDSVMLVDSSDELLKLASAPSMPDDYTQLLQNGLPIGPNMGSCGTAAYRKERVIVPDIKNSPLFKTSEEAINFAINNGLFACFSQPIISSKGVLLGTIANYRNKLGEPTADNVRILEWSARIAAITIERKQAEEALRESEERYRSLVNNVSLGIFRSAPGPIGTFLEVNAAMERITGYSRKELLRMDIAELYQHPEERQAVLEEVTSANGVNTRELHIRKKDGTEIIVSDTKVAVRDATGQVIYFDGIMEDITERKQMQERLMMTDRLSSIGELASGIAHELNNPLTSVIGFSQLLIERDISADIREDLSLIYSEAQRAAGVVKNLLTFARKHAPVRQLSQINNIIEDVLRLRAYEQKVNNIEVEKQLDTALPEIMVDYFQIQQVFLNIIINAEYFMIEAHNKGTLIISTERLDSKVKISITDDGPGISQENQSRIFDPFFTTKEVGRGTGLGLSICHGVVTEHGGRIFATSQTGKGATFVVELPIKGNQL